MLTEKELEWLRKREFRKAISFNHRYSCYTNPKCITFHDVYHCFKCWIDYYDPNNLTDWSNKWDTGQK